MALPGVNVTVNDGGLRVQRPPAGTRVLLLGTTTSTDLNVNEPVAILDSNLGIQALRNAADANGVRTESELSLAVAEAINAGVTSIEVVKIATADGLEYSGYSTDSRFSALSGAYAALRSYPTDLVVPVGVYAEDPIGTLFATSLGYFTGGSLTSESFLKQLANFCYQQTKDYNTSLGVISVKPPLMAPVVGSLVKTSYMSTGDAGYWFNNPSLANMTGWYGYLLGSDTSAVSPAWLKYLSGSTATYASQYLITSGFQAQTAAGVGETDDLGNKIDAGAYVNVVAMPARVLHPSVRKFAAEKNASQSNVSFNCGGAASYAGLITTLVPHSATTNKPIPGIVPSRRLSLSQAEGLMNYRMVTMTDRTRGYVVVNGVTGAYKYDDYTKSDYTQLTTVRITQAAIDGVRASCEPYIGEALNGPHLNAMREAVEIHLKNMKLAGALQDYRFTVVSSPDQQVIGVATVDLSIVPAFELTRVNVSVKLQKK